ncbi:cytochrome P450 [Russula vinacea]|nr:cytochrome P450 [Russula vinacea]
MGFFVVLSLFKLLDAIPTVGFSDPILSYLSAVRFNYDGVRMLKDGFEKTGPGLFKVANIRRWVVLVAGPDLIEEIKNAPDDVLSGLEAEARIHARLLDIKDAFHVDVVRSKMTQNMAIAFKEGREELIMAMDDVIPMRGEWVTVPIQETLQRVLCRTTNRIFVGVSLCRDYDYQTLNLNFADNASKLPRSSACFRSLSSRAQSLYPCSHFKFTEHTLERFAKMEEYGEDWDDKPMSTKVLYRLLANPEYMEPLRQEVDAVVKEEGWTKAGIDKMYKIDSFVRETFRIDSFTISSSLRRLALRPFTFSNGVTVPAGTFVAVPASATNTNEGIYPNANEFDGFRFSKLRDLKLVA